MTIEQFGAPEEIYLSDPNTEIERVVVVYRNPNEVQLNNLVKKHGHLRGLININKHATHYFWPASESNHDPIAKALNLGLEGQHIHEHVYNEVDVKKALARMKGTQS